MTPSDTTSDRPSGIITDGEVDNQTERTVGLYKSAQDSDYESVTCSVSDTINLGALGANANVSLASPYTYTSVGQNYSNNIYTIGPGNTTTWTAATTGTTAPWMQHNPTGAKIQLDGANADITVNGWSLVDAVKRIEERLGLYQPNPELEKEWEDLHALAEQYRKLEQHIRDKQATFDRLKAMPTPEPWPG